MEELARAQVSWLLSPLIPPSIYPMLIALPGVKFSKKVKSNGTHTFWPNWAESDNSSFGDDDDVLDLNDPGRLFAMFECWAGRAHDSQSANRLTNNYITHPTNTADPLRQTQWKTNIWIDTTLRYLFKGKAKLIPWYHYNRIVWLFSCESSSSKIDHGSWAS